ncbi:MAG: phosphoribosylanthranilate isomerase [Candidatus Omnitrophica bacterium]|nr:phosphoribosylanthranilate isomerase [Candidatus Omnitrophota bacterium]
MTKVKICGITNLEDALCAQACGANFIGFVFAESPRMIKPGIAARIIERLSPKIKIVALFADQKEKFILRVIEELGRVDALQLHGRETPGFCASFAPRRIIKAFRIKDENSIGAIKDYTAMDFALLDGYSDKAKGGTGKGFDLGLAVSAKRFGIPLFIAGGLNPQNVKRVVNLVKPFCVDVSSGVEKSAGKKDHGLIRLFIQNARSCLT